jgi:hypothetical protein
MTTVTKLVDEKTGGPINIGDKRKCHNYDGYVTITGWDAHGRNRVYYTYDDGYDVKTEGGKYAGVVGAKIIWEDA